MNKIPTAHKFFNQWLENNSIDNIEGCLIEFAKLHVQNSLKEASKKVQLTDFAYEFLQGSDEAIDQDSILNSYPLENIK